MTIEQIKQLVDGPNYDFLRTVVTFLHINGLIDDEKANEFLEENKK